MMKKDEKAVLCLRLGLAFVFLYVAIAGYRSPDAWVGFIPLFIKEMMSETVILYGHLLFNSVIGVWLLTNKKIFYASILAGLNLITIVIFNLTAFDIVFRDVGLIAASAALAYLTWKK